MGVSCKKHICCLFSVLILQLQNVIITKSDASVISTTTTSSLAPQLLTTTSNTFVDLPFIQNNDYGVQHDMLSIIRPLIELECGPDYMNVMLHYDYKYRLILIIDAMFAICTYTAAKLIIR